jgi:hypothetical protein
LRKWRKTGEYWLGEGGRVTATLKLTRVGYGIVELRRGRFEILVDDQTVGSLDKYRETAEFPVEAGQHSLRARKGRYSSRVLSFDVTDGQTVSFRCHGAMLWPRAVASFVVPGLAISLMRE